MTAFFSNKYLLFAVRVILAALFIYSALTKISDTGYFAKSLYNYRLLPEGLLNYFAVFIPVLELIIGMMILLGVYVKENALLGTILMIIFIGAITIALARGLDIECGCFGTKGGSRVGILRIIEDLIILFGFVWLFVYGSDFLAIHKPKKTPQKTEYPF